HVSALSLHDALPIYTGAIAWTQQFGTSGYDVAYAVQRAPSGELLVAGYVDGALPGFDGEGAEDAFWARFDPGGTLLSAAQFGGEDRKSTRLNSSHVK